MRRARRRRPCASAAARRAPRRARTRRARRPPRGGRRRAPTSPIARASSGSSDVRVEHDQRLAVARRAGRRSAVRSRRTGWPVALEHRRRTRRAPRRGRVRGRLRALRLRREPVDDRQHEPRSRRSASAEPEREAHPRIARQLSARRLRRRAGQRSRAAASRPARPHGRRRPRRRTSRRAPSKSSRAQRAPDLVGGDRGPEVDRPALVEPQQPGAEAQPQRGLEIAGAPRRRRPGGRAPRGSSARCGLRGGDRCSAAAPGPRAQRAPGDRARRQRRRGPIEHDPRPRPAARGSSQSKRVEQPAPGAGPGRRSPGQLVPERARSRAARGSAWASDVPSPRPAGPAGAARPRRGRERREPRGARGDRAPPGRARRRYRPAPVDWRSTRRNRSSAAGSSRREQLGEAAPRGRAASPAQPRGAGPAHDGSSSWRPRQGAVHAAHGGGDVRPRRGRRRRPRAAAGRRRGPPARSADARRRGGVGAAAGGGDAPGGGWRREARRRRGGRLRRRRRGRPASGRRWPAAGPTLPAAPALPDPVRRASGLASVRRRPGPWAATSRRGSAVASTPPQGGSRGDQRDASPRPLWLDASPGATAANRDVRSRPATRRPESRLLRTR